MNTFKECGFVKLYNIINIEDIDNINNIIYNFVKDENILRRVRSRLDINSDRYYINNEFNLIDSFEKMINYSKPVIYDRISRDRLVDNGVIDIFKPITLMPDIQKYINMELIVSLVTKITNIPYKIFSAKIIIQNGVINPMKFTRKIYKKDSINCNIFLSNIDDITNGPYVLIKYSNKPQYTIKDKDLEIIFGKRGDALIYDTNLLRKRLKQYGKNKINIYLSFILIPI